MAMESWQGSMRSEANSCSQCLEKMSCMRDPRASNHLRQLWMSSCQSLHQPTLTAPTLLSVKPRVGQQASNVSQTTILKPLHFTTWFLLGHTTRPSRCSLSLAPSHSLSASFPHLLKLLQALQQDRQTSLHAGWPQGGLQRPRTGTPQHRLHSILWIKAYHKASPDSGEGEVDSSP